jgi:NodT family efflux transporter outer membrane factor (OMF) lipoprotein
MHNKKFLILSMMILFIFNGCSVGPDYRRPSVKLPLQYKEIDKHWKIAAPNDDCTRGNWWEIFNDPQLNLLESKLNQANQNIASAKANYQQAMALVDEAKAGYFPALSAIAQTTRSKQGLSNNTTNTVTISNSRSLGLEASWIPDLFGSTRRTVESNEANAQAQAAQLALTRLTEQATLAQLYYQLRGIEGSQKILEQSVLDNQNLVKFAQNRYAAGVDALADVVQAESQLETAQAQSIDNGIIRAKTEHAMAVLVGESPSTFSFSPSILGTVSPPEFPLVVPSVLLERRPDIAKAEREVEQANANIGVAKAAYFPTLTLSASGNFQNIGKAYWLSLPAFIWSLGPSMVQTLVDGGLRKAQSKEAWAAYQKTVANYRQTVLSSFQEVEDSLVQLRLLNEESSVQHKASQNAATALKMVTNQYKAGTLTYTDVMIAQIAANSAKKAAVDTDALRMSVAVGLVTALGGGWS